MTIPTPTMQLEKPEAGDLMEPYFLGTMPSGGLWTILSRLDAHDHTGGLLGKPLTAATIPDGSITTSKLDPSVLAPYAAVDGSKPFTGPVTMQADAVVRDRLSFGEQGTSLAPDAYWERAGVGALRSGGNVGIGVAPAAWGSIRPAIQLASGGAITGHSTAQQLVLMGNSYYDASDAPRAIGNAAAARLILGQDGKFYFDNAPSVAAGAAQTFTTRLTVAQTGTVTLTPDAGGTPAITIGTRATFNPIQFGEAGVQIRNDGTFGIFQVETVTGFDVFVAGNRRLVMRDNQLIPQVDNGMNLGTSPNRWVAVYAVNGAIQTSSADLKEAITPLDPTAALAAVLATDPVVFDYKPPERDASFYELPDDPEQAEALLYQRLAAAPLEQAARHQAGFVLSSPDYATDPLFETGEGQSNAANTAGILLGATHALHAALNELQIRVAALEDAPPAVTGGTG